MDIRGNETARFGDFVPDPYLIPHLHDRLRRGADVLGEGKEYPLGDRGIFDLEMGRQSLFIIRVNPPRKRMKDHGLKIPPAW